MKIAIFLDSSLAMYSGDVDKFDVIDFNVSLQTRSARKKERNR